jgi:hypothetical protein
MLDIQILGIPFRFIMRRIIKNTNRIINRPEQTAEILHERIINWQLHSIPPIFRENRANVHLQI